MSSFSYRWRSAARCRSRDRCSTDGNRGSPPIQFAVEAVIPPFDFFRLHAALLAGLCPECRSRYPAGTEHVFMAFTGGAQQVGTPDKQVTRVVLPFSGCSAAKRIEPSFSDFTV